MDLLARIGFDPADTRPVIGMIGRLDRRRGSICSPGRRRPCSSAGCGSSSRAAAIRRWPTLRALALANPTARIHRAVRPGDGPQDLRRHGLLRDALALRAVRPGPDDRVALWDATDRPSCRRARRHGRRRDRATRARGPGSASASRRPRDSSRHVTPRSASVRRRSCWEGLLDRGHGGRFDWVTGAAPRYVDAYRRAVELRGAR